MPNTRLPWNSSLQHPFLATFALAAVLASLIFNFFQPGMISGLALALTGLSLAGLGYLEYRHFRSIKRAYNLAMLAAHDGFWEWNPVTKQLLVGTRLLQILGYREDFLPDTHAWLKLVHPDDVADYNRAVSRHIKGETDHFYCEYRVLASDGRYLWIASRGLAVRDQQGTAYQMVGSVTDITERKNHQEELEFLAQHDALTGLPNRLLFAEHLQSAINDGYENDQRLAVLFIDLDRFKNINDTLGHRAGDQMLQAVSLRLKQNLPANSCLYRQGGDEFIVLLNPVIASTDAMAVAQSIKESIAEPLNGGDLDFFTSASIGISLFPDDAIDGETLLRHADTAMYAAKSSGGNAIRTHTSEMDQRIHLRVSLETRLRKALQKRQFELYFQPQVSAVDGQLIGAEALLRWSDGTSRIPPDQFIPVAEECGLIIPIGEWVITQAIEQIAQWQDRFGKIPAIAINLSPRQFWRPSVSNFILDKLNATGLPTSALEVEITESVVLDPEGDSIEQLERMRAAGITIALDDFGTGYSSLSYLQRLPVARLKIDRSFIRELTHKDKAESNQALVKAIIAMAHSLSLKVIAEGVETTEQLEALQKLDCDIIQGYLISQPIAADEFAEKFLVDRNNQKSSE